MPNTFIHGKDGTVAIGATVFVVKQFAFKMSITKEDITHSGADGNQVLLPGIKSATGTLTFTYDTSNKPTIAPQQMTPGTVATLHLKPDGSDDYSFDALFHDFDFKSGPKAGDVECTVEASSTGPITVPAA